MVAQSHKTRIKASPLARRIARERGIDLAHLTGTGPEGRIVAEDVERAETARPAELVAQSHKVALPGEVEVVPLTRSEDDRAAADRGLDGSRSSSSRSTRT